MGNQVCCQSTQVKHSNQCIPVPLKSLKNIRKSGQIDANMSNVKDVVLNEQQITLDHFEKICQIGRGGFAIVYLVELKANIKKNIRIQYALKQTPKRKIFLRRMSKSIKLQKKVLAEMKSNFIIPLEYSFQDAHNCYLVMKYAQGGDLYSFIYDKKNSDKAKEFRRLGEFSIIFIVGCVVLALEVLHKHQIMYRDLKPQNVLVFSDGYPKLADFGLAKKYLPQKPVKKIAGTKVYLAPEIVQEEGYTHYVDFWTLGVFIYQLLVFDLPFDPASIVKEKYSDVCRQAEKNRDWKGALVSQQGKNIINSFLKVDPEERLGVKDFQDIKKHQFFKELDWEKLQKMEYQSPLKSLVNKYNITGRKCNTKLDKSVNESLSYEKIASYTYTNPLMI